MGHKKREIIVAAKYAPPYPQKFHAFWPEHAIKAGGLIAVIFLGLALLSYFKGVPMDPTMPPMPDDGFYVPSPEWYLMLLFQPFWYLTGGNAKWLPIGTFWLPLLAVVFLFLVPFIFRKNSKTRFGLKATSIAAIIIYALVVWVVPLGAVVASGAPIKAVGCPSCHNPMMGQRQALPPANMGEYYRVERQRQVDLGGYNIGGEDTEDHAGGSYKDSNWQLRHVYEPTMTW